MKLKGITKLVLAGTALAATAATLTTSTYAWYVTNANVDVLGASGSVASAETSGNLLVAQNTVVSVGENDAAHNEDRPAGYKVGLSSLDNASKPQLDNLVPQTIATADVYRYTKATAYAANTTYYIKGNNGAYTEAQQAVTSENFSQGTYYTQSDQPIAEEGDWVKADGSEIVGKLLVFKFWLKATSTTDSSTVAVTPVLTVRNTTENVASKKQVAYTATAGASQGESFIVDAVYALRMNVTTTTLTNDTLGTETSVVAKGSVVNIATDYSRLAGTVDPEETSITDYDANVYYKDVMGEIGYGTTASTGASPAATVTSWGAMNLQSGVDTLLTITFWLEGTDESCYDSCMSQSFAFDFNFSI